MAKDEERLLSPAGVVAQIQGSELFCHVEGALVRTLIGKDLTRVYDFSDKQLTVKSSSPDEHWRVAWKHY